MQVAADINANIQMDRDVLLGISQALFSILIQVGFWDVIKNRGEKKKKTTTTLYLFQ